MTELIFSTLHGSRLYGLGTPGSDYDVFQVTTSTAKRANHSVGGGIDKVTVGLDRFIENCFRGSHQSVEALFSPYKRWGEGDYAHQLRFYLGGLRITGSDVFERYERTIKTFCFGDFKRRRHAIRLNSNLNGLRNGGTFNPVMSPALIEWANQVAERVEGYELWNLLTTDDAT